MEVNEQVAGMILYHSDQAIEGPYRLRVSHRLAATQGWNQGQIIGNVEIEVVESRREKDIRLSERAKEIIKNLTDGDIDALIHYFGDGA